MAMMTATTANVPAIVPTTMAATFGCDGHSSWARTVDVNTTHRSVTALANRAIILRRHARSNNGGYSELPNSRNTPTTNEHTSGRIARAEIMSSRRQICAEFSGEYIPS